MYFSKDNDNVVVSETLINDYILRDDGSWFITESTTTLPEQNIKVRFRTEKVSFEEMPADFFNVDIPDNTLVHDRASGLRFVAGGDIPLATNVDAIIEESFAPDAPVHKTRTEAGAAVSETNVQTDPAQTGVEEQSHLSTDTTPLGTVAPQELPVVNRTPNLYIFVTAFSVTLLLCFCYLIWSRLRRKWRILESNLW